MNWILHFFKYSVALNYNGFCCIFIVVLIAFLIFLHLLFRRRLSLKRCIIIFIALVYLGFLFAVTVVSRQRIESRTVILTPFWSIRELKAGKTGYLTEILVNIIMFVPLGEIIKRLNKNILHTVSVCLLISVCIESIQYFFLKGFCELDDCIYNVCGAFVGALICIGFDAVNRRRKQRSFIYGFFEEYNNMENALKAQEAANGRNSGIELLKIFAIILIIISHIVQTVGTPNPYVPFQNYLINIDTATQDVQRLIMTMLRYSGVLGNSIFFSCSAWFLLDSEKSNKRKVIRMLTDIWIISIISLIFGLITYKEKLGKGIIVFLLMPNVLGSNWYTTCYLIFYMLHPFLNMLIKKLSKVVLFRTTLVLMLLYIFLNWIFYPFFGDILFTSNIVLWVAIYFLIAYIKLYLEDLCDNIKLNMGVLFFGIIGNCGVILITNQLGLHIDYLQDKLLCWNNNCNPFLIMTAIALLNIARNITFNNYSINLVSKMSLLIYIIHENRFFRIYIRPQMWQFVYEKYGYGNIVLWTMILTLVLFCGSLILSLIYKYTLGKVITKIENKAYPHLVSYYLKFEKNLLVK